MKVYAEAGIGNETFFSTEYEEGENEYRVQKFIKPAHVSSYYIRIWIFKTVYVLSTNDGFEITKKSKRKFKFLFGISGTD